MPVAIALTDVGAARSHNEDWFGVHPEHGLLVVADGVGGRLGGTTAARLTCETMAAFIAHSRAGQAAPAPVAYDPQRSPEANRLLMAAHVANRAVFDTGNQTPQLKGMASTVVAALVEGAHLHILHVGDSRAYRYRGTFAERLTRDHNEHNARVDLGMLPPDAVPSGKSNVNRVIGLAAQVQPELRTLQLAPGDFFLLCTDGLTDLLSDLELGETLDPLWRAPDLNPLAQRLVARANARGGNDNITVGLLRF